MLTRSADRVNNRALKPIMLVGFLLFYWLIMPMDLHG